MFTCSKSIRIRGVAVNPGRPLQREFPGQTIPCRTSEKTVTPASCSCAVETRGRLDRVANENTNDAQLLNDGIYTVDFAFCPEKLPRPQKWPQKWGLDRRQHSGVEYRHRVTKNCCRGTLPWLLVQHTRGREFVGSPPCVP